MFPNLFIDSRKENLQHGKPLIQYFFCLMNTPPTWRNVHRPVAHIYPRGTYKKQTFYYRGADTYQEPEWTHIELLKVRDQYKEALRQYKDFQREYEQVEQQFNESEKYTLKIADSLGEESSPTTENFKIRQKINKRIRKIEKLDAEIADIQFQIQPVEIGALQTELAAFGPQMDTYRFRLKVEQDKITGGDENDEVIIDENQPKEDQPTEEAKQQNNENLGEKQNDGEDLDDNSSEIREPEKKKSLHQDLLENIISAEYVNAVETAAEKDIAARCLNQMQIKLQNMHNDTSTLPSDGKSKRTAAKNKIVEKQDKVVLGLSDDYTEFCLQKEECDLQKRLASIHRLNMIRATIQRINELNGVLEYLGCEHVDMEEVKNHIEFTRLEEEEKSYILKQTTSPVNDKAKSRPVNISDRNVDLARATLATQKRATRVSTSANQRK